MTKPTAPSKTKSRGARTANAGPSAEEQAELLCALVESAPDIVIHLDRRGSIRFVNRLAAGFHRDDVIGSDWLSFVATAHHEQLKSLLQRTLTTGETTECEALGQGANGAMVWYWTRIAPVLRCGEIVGAVLVARDITEKKRTEAQLLVSDRMASLGTLAAGIAHEINNPLASVMANLESALRDVEGLGNHSRLPQDLREELRDARDSAERVRQIVRDVKLFSHSEGETRSSVQVECVIESTLRIAWNEIRHRARLVRNYGSVPAVYANESRLGQVFLNLIINAVHAIAEGDSEHNEIVVTTSVDARGRVVASIADTGSGIPEALRARLFTPFFTTKPVGIGTGLGLCICQRIVSSIGGQISFESEPGRGTQFHVTLPAAELVAADQAERSLPELKPA